MARSSGQRTSVTDILSGTLPNPLNPATSNTGSPTISQSIPGLEGLSATASGNIEDLLSGLPSAPWARTQNAYWGAGAGQPGGGEVGTFIGNRGADLYHQQAQQNRQQGFDDLMKMVQGYSGTVASTPGQIQQEGQFNREFAQQQANDAWNQLFQEKQLNLKSQAQNPPMWRLKSNNGPVGTWAGPASDLVYR